MEGWRLKMTQCQVKKNVRLHITSIWQVNYWHGRLHGWRWCNCVWAPVRFVGMFLYLFMSDKVQTTGGFTRAAQPTDRWYTSWTWHGGQPNDTSHIYTDGRMADCQMTYDRLLSGFWQNADWHMTYASWKMANCQLTLKSSCLMHLGLSTGKWQTAWWRVVDSRLTLGRLSGNECGTANWCTTVCGLL